MNKLDEIIDLIQDYADERIDKANGDRYANPYAVLNVIIEKLVELERPKTEQNAPH